MRELQAESTPLVFEDEARRTPTTRIKKVIAKRGSKPAIRINLEHKGVFIFCALGGASCEAFVMLSQKANSDAVKVFLADLAGWVGCRFRLVWDGNGNHVASGVKEEAEKLGIELVKMPPYQPKLNPVEEVWRQLNHYLANRLFFTVEEVTQAIKEFFEERNYKFNISIAKYFTE
ncbi:MAG: IS630 family transposase [Candidatus Freyarchaeota archaeon]